eukprot:8902996-Lingulodinium_polyedra.AAC.1
MALWTAPWTSLTQGPWLQASGSPQGGNELGSAGAGWSRPKLAKLGGQSGGTGQLLKGGVCSWTTSS